MLQPILFRWNLVCSCLVACIFFLSVDGLAQNAGVDEVQACAQAYEQAQVTRNNGQLVEAQEQLLICVQDGCPDFVKTDCGRWLSEVKREIPSIILSAQNNKGEELSDVSVTMGGEQVAASLDGKSIEVNPGQYEFVFQYGDKQESLREVIRQGEKNRVISVTFVTFVDSDGDSFPDSDDLCPKQFGANNGCPPDHPANQPAQAGDNRGMRAGAYASWGVGAAGLATWGAFGLWGRATERDVIDECLDEEGQQICGNEREVKLVSDVETKFLVANVGLGVGIAGAAVGTVLFLLSLEDPDPPARANEPLMWNVATTPDGGGFVSVRGAF